MGKVPGKPEDEAASVNTSNVLNTGRATLQLATWDEIELGELIGQGSFASVYKVESLKSTHSNVLNGWCCAIMPSLFTVKMYDSTGTSATSSDDSNSDSSSLAVSCHICWKYALKTIRQDLLEASESDSCRSSVEDARLSLQSEADLLAKLPEHENIVRLFGHSSAIGHDSTPGFLLLELLKESLSDRLKRWKRRKVLEQGNSMLSSLFAPRDYD